MKISKGFLKDLYLWILKGILGLKTDVMHILSWGGYCFKSKDNLGVREEISFRLEKISLVDEWALALVGFFPVFLVIFLNFIHHDYIHSFLLFSHQPTPLFLSLRAVVVQETHTVISQPLCCISQQCLRKCHHLSQYN